MTFDQITKQVKQKEFSPIYYFFGEEPYFIDKLTKQLENNVLEPSEEAFNKIVLYGGDAKAEKLLNELRSFPMMATRRLVVLREAQRMRKDQWEKLESYIANPLDSTVFVIAWKGKGMDGRSKFSKALKKKAVSFESKALYENKVGAWIESIVKKQEHKLQANVLNILVAYLGTNLSLIESELDKIFLYMKDLEDKTITTKIVYELINIDKDFNVFELMNCIGQRDHSKSHLIINQMMKNLKDHPPILIVFQLFQFFNKLALLKSKGVNDPNGIAAVLGMSPFIARQYVTALRNFSDKEIRRNLIGILEADLFLKGIHNTHMSQEHVLKTMIFNLLN